MKYLFAIVILCGSILRVSAQAEKKFNDSNHYLQPVEVQAIRAGDKAPFAKNNLYKKDIEKNNLARLDCNVLFLN